jgi:hypothetical protein
VQDEDGGDTPINQKVYSNYSRFIMLIFGIRMTEKFDARLAERTYEPDPAYKANSWIRDYSEAYKEFLRDPDGFWDGMAKELCTRLPQSGR